MPQPKQLQTRGAKLRLLNLDSCDPNTAQPTSSPIFTIQATLAQKEHDITVLDGRSADRTKPTSKSLETDR